MLKSLAGWLTYKTCDHNWIKYTAIDNNNTGELYCWFKCNHCGGSQLHRFNTNNFVYKNNRKVKNIWRMA